MLGSSRVFFVTMAEAKYAQLFNARGISQKEKEDARRVEEKSAASSSGEGVKNVRT